MLLHTGTPNVQLKLSTIRVGRARPFRLDWIVDLLPADFAQGLTITDALLRIAPQFTLDPFLTKAAEITDDASDDGRGALNVVLSEADAALIVGHCAYELTAIDSSGREAVLDRGAIFLDPASIPGSGTIPRLGLLTQPSASATSGVPFVQQPVVQLYDALGAPLLMAGVSVTAAVAHGNGSLTGSTTVVTDANGVATFTDLAVVLGTTADTITLKFTAPGLASAGSSGISVTGGSSGGGTPLIGDGTAYGDGAYTGMGEMVHAGPPTRGTRGIPR
ncbi:MAG TPA: hypothetical protein VH439_17390 [Gemmatimonadales bacterium]|jgi:hypothetical protein